MFTSRTLNIAYRCEQDFFLSPFRSLNSNGIYSLKQRTIEEEIEILNLIRDGVQQKRLFDDAQCIKIEGKINRVVERAEKGKYKPCTVDRAPLRNK